ncbi:TonB family protein [Flavihumibacter sp. R14]|nr:TonB family protein [Flavihumibacter soli]
MLIISLLITLIHITGFMQDPQPSFKGGERNLYSFIKNHQIYPEYSKSNCLQGTVHVSFKLGSSGNIYSSEVQKGFGTDLDDEALRIIRLSSGRWIVPSGYDTTTALVLPINFSLKDYDCENRNRDEINAALAAYKARTDLTKAIYNYYDKKAAGEAVLEEEIGILQLKAQLGYNEKYIDRLYKQALRKLKQGDLESGCEDLHTIRRLGSDIADKSIEENCR